MRESGSSRGPTVLPHKITTTRVVTSPSHGVCVQEVWFPVESLVQERPIGSRVSRTSIGTGRQGGNPRPCSYGCVGRPPSKHQDTRRGRTTHREERDRPLVTLSAFTTGRVSPSPTFLSRGTSTVLPIWCHKHSNHSSHPTPSRRGTSYTPSRHSPFDLRSRTLGPRKGVRRRVHTTRLEEQDLTDRG